MPTFFPNCTISILFCLLAAMAIVGRSEPVPIDLVEQHGEKDRHGHGDVVELWEENRNNPRMRNALRANAQNRWTIYRDIADAKFVIPFVISGEYKLDERATIQRAMHKIEQNTCIKFRARRDEKDFVDIQNEYGEGCYTNVGRISGRNVLMLESSEEETCITNSTVLHELLHKVGLWHEQMRQDRDEYITVHFENIPFYLHAQFRKVNGALANNYGVRYDYRSVMHYGQHAFASPEDAIAMETLNKRFQTVIGNAMDASRGDYIKVCAAYGCPVCMGDDGVEFDVQKAARTFAQELLAFEKQMDEKVADNGKKQNAEQTEEAIEKNDAAIGNDDGRTEQCTPLPMCGTMITRERSPSLYKRACCPPCSECRPEPFCSEQSYATLFPTLYKYDCCGYCARNGNGRNTGSRQQHQRKK